MPIFVLVGLNVDDVILLMYHGKDVKVSIQQTYYTCKVNISNKYIEGGPEYRTLQNFTILLTMVSEPSSTITCHYQAWANNSTSPRYSTKTRCFGNYSSMNLWKIIILCVLTCAWHFIIFIFSNLLNYKSSYLRDCNKYIHTYIHTFDFLVRFCFIIRTSTRTILVDFHSKTF